MERRSLSLTLVTERRGFDRPGVMLRMSVLVAAMYASFWGYDHDLESLLFTSTLRHQRYFGCFHCCDVRLHVTDTGPVDVPIVF